MKIYKDIIQQTDEWDEIKKGKMSASHGTAIGNCGKGLDTYVVSIVKGMIVKQKDSYSNSDMDRGNELEPIARQEYEFEYGVTVDQVGFIEYNDYVGVSPDGLIGEDGLWECKARNDDKHFDLLLTEKVDSGTIWQMNMQMLVSDRKWCDFVSYNPNFKQSLFVKRFYPDEKKQSALLKGFEVGEQKIKELLNNDRIKFELNK